MRVTRSFLLFFAFASALYSAVANAAVPDAQELAFSVNKFQLSDPVPLTDEQVDALLLPYIGRTLTVDELLQAAKSLEDAIRDEGWAFYRIVLPPQTVDAQGNVFLQVVNFKVGTIAVEGNKHFSRENILRMLPGLSADAAPNIDRLSQEVRYANRHPTKRMELLFREGKEEKTVDARVRIQDDKPQNAFGILRNTGSPATGKWRFSLGYQNTNVFDRDHVFNITATTTPDKHHHDDVQQLGVSYGIPLYRFGAYVDVYYAKSSVDSGVIENFFEVAGSGHQAGVRFTKYLPRIAEKWDHEVTLSLEDKHFKNDISLFAAPAVPIPGGGDVRSRPMGIKWSLNRETALLRYGGHLGYFRNLPGGVDNTDSAYDNVRSSPVIANPNLDMDADWEVWRFGGFGNFSLPENWRFNFDFSGQWTDEALIPGEQQGVGGLASVRGYTEREISGDSGYVLRTEMVAPPVKKVAMHAFFDHGMRDLEDFQGPTKDWDSLSSAGFGARYSLGPVAMRFDLARPLDNGPQTNAGTWFLHSYFVVKY